MLPMIKETYDLLGKLHEKTAFQPMLHHEILTSDYMVQKSTFGDKTEVIVNYGITSYNFQNIVIPPKGFILNVPNEGRKIAAVGRKITYIQE